MNNEEKIIEIVDAIKKLLLEKNKRYGDAALNPQNIFYKGDSTQSIEIRLDDKLSRIKNNNSNLRVNDISDIIGYCILLLISIGATKKDLEKLID